jgi:hypothetical protein
LKKIDLHIHTIPSISDANFEFSLGKLQEYIEKLEIDCIAITNHNLFDLQQFRDISSALGIDVLPGIEIDVEKGHLLLISDNDELEDFAAKCQQIKEQIPTENSWITVDVLKQIFLDLGKYLIIPHYDKKPAISEQSLTKLSPHAVSGEVTSARKFRSCAKDETKPTPVIFSDVRISDRLSIFPTRQTFVDLSTISVRGLKLCLADKGKVCLSKDEGNRFFQVTDDGLFLSTGLNIVLGERSSGKTYTLNRIISSFDNYKYIKQFSLLQNDEEKFKDLLSTRNSNTNEEFLKEFKEVVADVAQIDLRSGKLEVEKYVNSLLKYASESDKLDSYSKATLFGETLFGESDLKGLERLIDATIILIDNRIRPIIPIFY